VILYFVALLYVSFAAFLGGSATGYLRAAPALWIGMPVSRFVAWTAIVIAAATWPISLPAIWLLRPEDPPRG